MIQAPKAAVDKAKQSKAYEKTSKEQGTLRVMESVSHVPQPLKPIHGGAPGACGRPLLRWA